MKIEELKIPAPWGHIAAKAWNDRSSETVLVAHGMLDNAGSFDNLIPLLPKHFCYVCFDFPGHGLSDNFGNGALLHTLDHVLVFKILVDYFQQEKYIIIAHSYGAQTSMLFAQLYPQHVFKEVILDAISFKPMNLFQSLDVGLDLVFDDTKADARNVHTYEEGVTKIMKNRVFGRLNRESAENLAKRALKKIGEDKFVFRTDVRTKAMLGPFFQGQQDYVKETHLKYPLKCQCVFILLNESPFTKIWWSVYDHFKERGFEIHNLEGHHDYHMTNPEAIAPIIVDFLLRKNKL